MSQRDHMRHLYKQHGDDETVLVAQYAKAERNSLVTRKRNTHNISSEQYSKALYKDGIRKGWIME